MRRAKTEFSRAKSMRFALSRPLDRKISLFIAGKSVAFVAHPVPQEGRFAIVTNVGMGCGGRGSAVAPRRWQGKLACEPSDRAKTNGAVPVFAEASADVHMPSKFLNERRPRTAKPCGPDTRCWCQVDGGVLSPTGLRSAANSSTTVARRIRRRGERGISR
jgi:hypothetical protein